MTTWAEAANQMVEVVGRLAILQEELANWAAGTVYGGPLGTGDYPFTQPDGSVRYLPSIEKLQLVNGDPTGAINSLEILLEELTSETGHLADLESRTEALQENLEDMHQAFDAPFTGLPVAVLPYNYTVAGSDPDEGYKGALLQQISDTVRGDIYSPNTRVRHLNNRLAFMPITGKPVTQTNSATGRTYHQMISFDTSFDSVRIYFENQLTSAVSFGPIKVATMTSLNGGLGNALTWTTVTFGGSTTATIPAGTSSNPQFLESDPISISSAVRTDVPGRGILLVRTFAPAAMTTIPLQGEFDIFADTYRVWANDTGGRVFSCWYADGDGVTNPASFSASPTPSNWWPCLGGVVNSTHPSGECLIIANPGDSIQFGPTAGNDSHVYNAIRDNNTPGTPIGWVNMGWVGQSTTQYLARAQRFFPILQPTVAFYTAWSPNDRTNPIESDYARCITNLTAFLTLCDSLLILPVLCTSTPRDSYTLAEDNIRQRVDNYVRDLAGKYLICDYEEVISQKVRPARYVPALAASDGLHPSPAGYAAMGKIDSQQLRKIIARKFQRFVPETNKIFNAIYGGNGYTNSGKADYDTPMFQPAYGGDATKGTISNKNIVPFFVATFGGDARNGLGVS